MGEALAHDFRVIDAQHQYEARLKAELTILRIVVRVLAGHWVGLRDRWTVLETVDRYPEFEHYLDYIEKKAKENKNGRSPL